MRYNKMQTDFMREKLANDEAVEHGLMRRWPPDKQLHKRCLERMNNKSDDEITKLWEKKYGEFDG